MKHRRKVFVLLLLGLIVFCRHENQTQTQDYKKEESRIKIIRNKNKNLSLTNNYSCGDKLVLLSRT